MLLVPAAASADDPVTISGKAYVFNHMDTPIPGATIRVRELPDVTATTDANGDYVLTVPDDTTVTPYIDPPAATTRSTCRPARREPRQRELPGCRRTPVPRSEAPPRRAAGPKRRAHGLRHRDHGLGPQRARRRLPDVLGQDPHGIPVRPSIEFPEIPGPIYFNEHVIPDATKAETSGRRDRLDRGARRYLPDRHAQQNHAVRQLPGHLRAGSHRQQGLRRGAPTSSAPARTTFRLGSRWRASVRPR